MKANGILTAILLIACIGLGYLAYDTNGSVKALHAENVALYRMVDSLLVQNGRIDSMLAQALASPGRRQRKTVQQKQTIGEAILEAMLADAAEEREAKAKAGPQMQVSSSYRLEDRYTNFLYEPDAMPKEEGRVVIDIVVDESGKVLKTAVNGESTLTDEETVEPCRKAALRTCFNSRYDLHEAQAGTVTYTFAKVQ